MFDFVIRYAKICLNLKFVKNINRGTYLRDLFLNLFPIPHAVIIVSDLALQIHVQNKGSTVSERNTNVLELKQKPEVDVSALRHGC